MVDKIKLAFLLVLALTSLLEMSSVSFASATCTVDNRSTQIIIQSPISNQSYSESSVRLVADIRLVYGTSSPKDEFVFANLTCNFSLDGGDLCNFDSMNITSNTATPDVNFWTGLLHRLNITYTASLHNLTDGPHSLEIILRTGDSWSLYEDVAQINFTTNSQKALITINSDGSITPPDVPIRQKGNVYAFTCNISGNIQVRKSNIVIDGAGFTLNGNNATGISISSSATEHPSELDIWNVTVKNLRITNSHIGIDCEFGGNHTFFGDYLSNDCVTQNETGGLSWDNLGIALWGSSGNCITHCTIGGSPAIYMHFVCSNNVVAENNIIFGADLRISGIETFDRNYWADYSTRYPYASEVDSSGIWNFPYAFADSANFEGRVFQDNNPLTSPIAIPTFSSNLPTLTLIKSTTPTALPASSPTVSSSPSLTPTPTSSPELSATSSPTQEPTIEPNVTPDRLQIKDFAQLIIPGSTIFLAAIAVGLLIFFKRKNKTS